MNFCFLAYTQKIDTPESFISLIFFLPEKLPRFFLLKEVKTSPDRKMIKRLTFYNFFLPLRHSR